MTTTTTTVRRRKDRSKEFSLRKIISEEWNTRVLVTTNFIRTLFRSKWKRREKKWHLAPPMNWSITKKERQQQPAPRGFLMEQKQKERKRERKRERERRVERTRWQPDRIRVETQTAPRSLIHRGLYQNLITSEAKATAREER